MCNRCEEIQTMEEEIYICVQNAEECEERGELGEAAKFEEQIEYLRELIFEAVMVRCAFDVNETLAYKELFK